jgi:hypothetical protein
MNMEQNLARQRSSVQGLPARQPNVTAPASNRQFFSTPPGLGPRSTTPGRAPRVAKNRVYPTGAAFFTYFALRRKMSPLKVFIVSSAPPLLILP